MNLIKKQLFHSLSKNLDGDLLYDEASLLLYSTDASAYREKPLAVVLPKTARDLKEIICYVAENSLSIAPRAGGTSLAGQVVGNGIVVDVSRYLTKILELNIEERWVRVEPGVVLDDLNKHLKSYGLMFGPETSTSNRCTLGGMVGNNACGAHSIIYGSTRDHVLETLCLLSDGSEVVFKSISDKEFKTKCDKRDLEGYIYNGIYEILKPEKVRNEILAEFPDPKLKRRNTGYAIDILCNSSMFKNEDGSFNMSNIIAGSEGTLAIIKEIKLNLVPIPSGSKMLVCAHFNSLEEALEANIIALGNKPWAIELMDKTILDCTKNNIEQSRNRFFISGDPAALLIIELMYNNRDEIKQNYEKLEKDIRNAGYGYHFALVTGSDIEKVWSLRKAGLGVLSNIPGDAKPVSVIEDTAVHPELLPHYIADFKLMLSRFKLEAVFHGHAATGELHLRPVLNLKEHKDVEKFRLIAQETALLVKKYKGSLSGEHGDGRLRGQFIPIMIGDSNYELLKKIKRLWDPKNIFNPGKIIDVPDITSSLRSQNHRKPEQLTNTVFDFSDVQGFLRMIENCNGSSDCRKSELSGGAMCPSYMATRDERYATRARANLLREILTDSSRTEPFNSKEVFEILDDCLSCKACKSECPSNVDMAKLKSEFLYQYYMFHKVPWVQRIQAYQPALYKIGSRVPGVFNFLVSNNLTSQVIKQLTGIATPRKIPRLSKQTWRSWCSKNLDGLNKKNSEKSSELFLFIDEFTNYLDAEIGIASILLLHRLGYKVNVIEHDVSGRTYISKGLLKTAKKIANANISRFDQLIGQDKPLVGIEPSAILSFRDEYPVLVDDYLKDSAKSISQYTFTIEEFIVREFEQGKIKPAMFTEESRQIKFHCHCHQKSLSTSESVRKMLSIPANYQVVEISSGCCGMAGAFGYEKKHYDLSVKISELTLIPEIRETNLLTTIIVATGNSCRHQIDDALHINTYHPVEILYKALK